MGDHTNTRSWSGKARRAHCIEREDGQLGCVGGTATQTPATEVSLFWYVSTTTHLLFKAAEGLSRCCCCCCCCCYLLAVESLLFDGHSDMSCMNCCSSGSSCCCAAASALRIWSATKAPLITSSRNLCIVISWNSAGAMSTLLSGKDPCLAAYALPA